MEGFVKNYDEVQAKGFDVNQENTTEMRRNIEAAQSREAVRMFKRKKPFVWSSKVVDNTRAAAVVIPENAQRMTELQNALSGADYVPQGLPFFELAKMAGEVYEQNYWTGDVDVNNKKMTVEDYVVVKNKPDRAFFPDVYYSKKGQNFSMTPENLEDGESSLPGAQSPLSEASYNLNFENGRQENLMFAVKLVKNMIQMRASAVFGIDQEAEMLEGFTKLFAARSTMNALVGSVNRPGLVRLGSTKIQLGTEEAKALLGGFAGTTLNADLSAGDYRDIGNGIFKMIRGISLNKNNIAWEAPCMAVSPEAYAQMQRGMQLEVDGKTFAIGQDGLQIMLNNAKVLTVMPLTACGAESPYNPFGKDLVIIYDKSYTCKYNVMPLSMFGSWQTADSMNYQVFYTAQYTRPFLIDDSRFVVFTAA